MFSALGVKIGSGLKKTFDRIKEWEPKAMSRLYRFKEDKDEKWSDYHTKTQKKGEKILVPLLSEVIAESMWRAMGWVCYERPNAVINTLKQVFGWRNTKRCHSTQASGMKNDHKVETQMELA